MKTHRVVIGAVAIGLTACVAVLGLEGNDFETFDLSLCQRYAEVCGSSADGLGLGISSDPKLCQQEIASRLDASITDPTRPSVEKYTELHCRSKTTCAEFLDCLAGSNVLTNPSMACASGQCVGEATDAGPKPWRCCANNRCLAADDGSVCQADRFACLGDAAPFAKPDPTGMTFYDVVLQFADINTQQPITTDIAVVACNKLDPACLGPIALPTPDAGTMPGQFSFHLPRAFDGFLQVKYTPPDGGPNLDYMTLLVFVFPPLEDTMVTPTTMNAIPLFRRASFNNIAQSLGKMVDPNLGHVFGFTFDCNRQLADGVVAKMDVMAGAQIYFQAGLPNPMGTQTDPTGQVGFVNVQPGLHSVTTTVKGVRLGTTPMIVRPDTLSFSAFPATL